MSLANKEDNFINWMSADAKLFAPHYKGVRELTYLATGSQERDS